MLTATTTMTITTHAVWESMMAITVIIILIFTVTGAAVIGAHAGDGMILGITAIMIPGITVITTHGITVAITVATTAVIMEDIMEDITDRVMAVTMAV